MAIRLSSSRNIDALVADLSAAEPITREAAVARLTIIGTRAVERLIGIVESTAPAEARTAALRALDAIGDPRCRAAILHALADPDAAVASAAAGAAGGHLRGPHGADVLDHLTRTALDRSRLGAVRAAALRAVRELDAPTIAPLLDSLRHDADDEVRAAAAWTAEAGGEPGAAAPAAILAAAARGQLPPAASDLREAIARTGGAAALPDLLRVVEAVRMREASEPVATRPGWTSARAAAHLTLAGRGSRIALYDLRDTLAATDVRLPVEWLAALAAVGDASCLEAIAAAHARTADAWWREHLADTFRAIVEREALTRRHAVIRKIEKRWPEIWATGKAGGAGKAGEAGRTGEPGRAGKAGRDR